jgi:hypothetical protein
MKQFAFATFVVVGLVASPLAQEANETLVVTPVNTRGWTTADTRPGGEVSFVEDATAPAGSGALRLTTNATTAAKAQYLHETSTPLAEVTDLSYYTKQNSALFAGGDPSYQLLVNLCPGNPPTQPQFTTFVFEPYQNGVVIPGAWQSWDVDAGLMWSSRSVTCVGGGSVVAGGGGAPFYTLAELQAAFPSAVAIGFGVNIGSNNAGYDVEADLVRFNATTYDFEVFSTPSNAEECKNGGWSTFNPPSGPYTNQGQCVSATNH